MTVGKDCLARVVSEKTGLNLIDTRLLVVAFLEALKGELADGKRVELRGLGSFYVKKCKASKARNPRNGEKVQLPARKRPVFKVSRQVVEKLNENKGSE
ncbi:MAG: integration host factor subunit beta [Chitinivibrionia bacterium]|nr:integration host factor subunit beta [Chitinivibrionia bacterium]